MNGRRGHIVSQREEPAPGVLYVVGTPIGHLGDLSPRARAVLANVSAIACEDTRHSGQLLTSLGAQGQRFSFHQHNTQTRLPQLLQLLQVGKSLALISDAGLPGISDPGEQLVAASRAAGLEVICIPGPCAATTALVSSGLPSGRFCFEGFLPTKNKDRKQRLETVANEIRTTVIYEAPHRLVQLLRELAELCGHERPIQVARELTKRHEQQVGPTIAIALQHFLEHKPVGECTLVLGGAPAPVAEEHSNDHWRAELQALIDAGSSASDAARQLAQQSGQSRRTLYALLHQSSKDQCD